MNATPLVPFGMFNSFGRLRENTLQGLGGHNRDRPAIIFSMLSSWRPAGLVPTARGIGQCERSIGVLGHPLVWFATAAAPRQVVEVRVKITYQIINTGVCARLESDAVLLAGP